MSSSSSSAAFVIPDTYKDCCSKADRECGICGEKHILLWKQCPFCDECICVVCWFETYQRQHMNHVMPEELNWIEKQLVSNKGTPGKSPFDVTLKCPFCNQVGDWHDIDCAKAITPRRAARRSKSRSKKRSKSRSKKRSKSRSNRSSVWAAGRLKRDRAGS